MVMSSETKEVKELNGKKSSSTNSPLNSSTKPVETSPETSDDDSLSKKNLNKSKNNGKSEFEEKIRVGKDFQATVPDLNPKKGDGYTEKALLVWSPAKDIPENKIEEYVDLANVRYGYNTEQALGMLFWHKHDLEKALLDLGNFTPFPEEWSKEDKVLFEQAFQFHGKCFHRIRQMLPDKSIASLVRYYYSWKKTRHRTSIMDRQEKRKNDGIENGNDDDLSENSDVEDKKFSRPIRGIQRTSRSPTRTIVSNLNADNISSKISSAKVQDIKRVTGINRIENKDTGYSSSSSSSNGISKLSSLNCQNCKVLCNELKPTTSGSFCSSCFQHWRRTGELRPISGPNVQRPRSKTNKLYYYQGYHDGSIKYKRKPPKGMYINHDDVLKLAAQELNEKMTPRKQPVPPKFDLLAETDREIGVLYSQIQANKQKISCMKSNNESFHDTRQAEEAALSRVNIRWTKDELALAIMGFRKFGQNFKAIAEVISTKSESHVRKFFIKSRKSRNLDTVCQEATSSSAQQQSNSNDGETKQDNSIEIMEVIDSDDDMKIEHVENGNNTGNNGMNGTTNEENNVKVQGKASIVLVNTAKSLKRKHDNDADKSNSTDVLDDEGAQKKFAPFLGDKNEITITPIRKISADDKQNASVA
ncbi:unnamed protein product [Chironomus riparius]|uniref:Uncharacterized protein n=1 Tax=Chironomus riparius TaxID=315576 RepID=A0A9N9RS40_9DIPT|nr:unnamed protein product [Chironomus riparius]